MARSDLFSAAKNAQQVYSMIKDVSEDEGLDGWVQEKIIKANDYLNTIREYLEGKQVQSVNEGAEIMYAEELAEKVFEQSPNLQNEDDILTRGFQLAKKDPRISGRVNSIFRTEDFPSDFVSYYRYIQHNHGIRSGMNEGSQKVDTLVTDALKIMRGAEVSDAVRALTTVLGNREYNSRRGFYNFYIRQILDMYGQQGVTEGSRNAYLKHNNLVDLEKPLAGLKDEFNKFLRTHDPEEKQKFQQGIKQRIKTRPMAGPKGVLPEQGISEGAKVDRMVKHIEKSEEKSGKSKKEAENIAWATANKRGMLNNKNKKA
jgi:hypothetical protein